MSFVNISIINASVARAIAAAAAAKAAQHPNSPPAFVPPAVQPKPVPMPIVMPPTFDSAPERAQVITGVKDAIGNINEIIDLLNHPIARKGDLIDMDYAPETVTTFKVRSAECEHNLALASVTASAWFTSVGKTLQDVTDALSKVKKEMNTTDQEIAKNTALIEANVKAIADLTKDKEHESQLLAKAQADYNHAQDRLNSARSEQSKIQTARNWLCWCPIAAVALTVVDLTKEENDVNSARTVVGAEGTQVANDKTLLAKTGVELRNHQQDGITLHATLTGLQTNERALQAQQDKLNEDSKYLGPLKINIDHALHTVSSALGSGSNVDNMMSMKNVGTSIKGLVDALKNDGDFNGALAAMNEQGWAELDQRIQAMQKASKKPKLNV